jgi:acyl-CoA synthetase (AMP-forming)/AMP-acid ligase II
MTYSEMIKAIRKLSGSLRRKGLCIGDTVLLIASNHIQLALVYFAVWKAGGCCASLSLDLFPGIAYTT